MKYIYILSITIILFSCNSGENESIKFLNEGLLEANENLEYISEDLFAEMEKFMQENPRKVIPFKNNTDTIRLYRDKLIDLIKEIDATLLEKNNLLKSTSYKKDELLTAIGKYNQYIDFCIKKYKFKISIDKLNEIQINRANLGLLQNKAIISSYNVLSGIVNNLGDGLARYRINKLKPVVIPKSRTVKLGGTYEAEIFLAALDSTLNIKVVIGQDTLFSDNNSVQYSMPTTKIGRQKIGGVLIINNPSAYEELKFPFKTEFKVVK